MTSLWQKLFEIILSEYKNVNKVIEGNSEVRGIYWNTLTTHPHLWKKSDTYGVDVA